MLVDMRSIVRHILGALMALAFLPAQAQETDPDSIRTRFLVGARAHYGFIIIHSRDLAPVKDSYPWGAELDFGWQFVNKKAWEFCNCYPRAGAALTFWDWDSRVVLGYGLTAVAYVEPIFLTRHRLQLSIRMGGGLSLLTRPYHPTENPYNFSYSTYLNFPLMVNVGLNYRIDPRWNLRLAANYNHVSNGGLRLPNKGINYPTASLGADYAFQAIDFKARAKLETKVLPDPRLRLALGGILTFKNGGLGDDDQFGVFGGFVQGVYYLGKWSGLNLGAEWISDNARRARMQYWGRPENHQRGAVLVGHEFLLGRVVFSQQLGVYFYDRWRENDPVYQRFGLSFKFTEHIFAGFNLKTHRHVADFLDLRAGWLF